MGKYREERKRAFEHRKRPWEKVAITVLFLLVGYSFWWNTFVYLEKMWMMVDLLHNSNYTADTYIERFKEVMAYHPELQEAVIPIWYFQGVRNIIGANPTAPQTATDVRKIADATASYTLSDPTASIYPGRIYAWLWLKDNREDDYQKSVYYFQQSLSLFPKMPFALYDLQCIYRIHGDIENANKMEKIIESNWGTMTEDQKTSII